MMDSPFITIWNNTKRSKQVAIALRFNGERSNEMLNVVQNHHADNSLIFVTPVFS
jgi:hypothetical protein